MTHFRTDIATNFSRSETIPSSSQNNIVIIVTGDANQLLSANVDSDGRQERANSATSIASTLSLTGDFCKICHCGGEPNTPLITPCFCSGSLKHVHQVGRHFRKLDFAKNFCNSPEDNLTNALRFETLEL